MFKGGKNKVFWEYRGKKLYRFLGKLGKYLWKISNWVEVWSMVKVLLEGEEVFLMIRGEEYSRLWSRYFVYWSGG